MAGEQKYRVKNKQEIQQTNTRKTYIKQIYCFKSSRKVEDKSKSEITDNIDGNKAKQRGYKIQSTRKKALVDTVLLPGGSAFNHKQNTT